MAIDAAVIFDFIQKIYQLVASRWKSPSS